MRSGELARLAGVTVRALRHYHQIGVVAEPARSVNGYREYDVHDLIRVLRIKRMASLGIPLDQMPELLDDTRNGGELLDELDAELAGQIDRLTRQRDLIAQLRNHDASPDLPPELAPFLTVLASAGMPPELARFDRDQSVLLAHLVGTDGLPHLAQFYERLSDPRLLPVVAAVSERFAKLGPDSTEHDFAELTEGIMTTIAPVVEDFATSDPPVDLSAAVEIFAGYATDLLNEQQRLALAELERRLGDRRKTWASCRA
ncbi:MerR family transcriptional regulator [Agromyces mediolanus]|uniref:MerR family transcriptional regulator n=1 Tax=Agromyces mediolanus TaxID=41986 RepID=A0A918CKY9_AGRME|nr:MerR family transcriptional regulator [Agromyces mediolanus]GGR27327.1 MerR family transcriptional regulator [Agromyces mediolanus]GLJ71909.1 MerR family transcriptional regulator [Agromyces mediolanus]